MVVYNSQQLLNQLQEQTEQFIAQAVSNWQVLSHKQFGYKQLPEKWSANQCLQHLNSYGTYYLPAIEKAITIAKTKEQQNNNQFKSGWLGNYFTNLMQPKANGSLSKKMQAPKNHQPTNNSDSNLSIAEFIDQQERLLLLLEQAKEVNLNSTKVPISISPFIKLKLGDVFMFLVAHNFRHVLQANSAIGYTKLTT
ncbi:MAG: DinB family protein [Chitinophagaceae bacterium]|nr:DinB family protein [Chitinophagaceae bacterium]